MIHACQKPVKFTCILCLATVIDYITSPFFHLVGALLRLYLYQLFMKLALCKSYRFLLLFFCSCLKLTPHCSWFEQANIVYMALVLIELRMRQKLLNMTGISHRG